MLETKNWIEMTKAEMAILTIKEKVDELDLIKGCDQFNSWQKATIGTLRRAVPNNTIIIEHLSDIKSLSNYSTDETETAKRQSRQILLSLIKDIERFGLEETPIVVETKEVIKVDVSQNNHQGQTANISIQLNFLVDIVKDGLTVEQVKELKSILDSSKSSEEKKKSIKDKIKSFGLDVTSNIIASILTNPQVYGQFGALL